MNFDTLNVYASFDLIKHHNFQFSLRFMMERAEDEKYQKLYPELPALPDEALTQSEDSDEDGGEEYVIPQVNRRSPVTPSPIRSSAGNSPIRRTHSEDPQKNTTTLSTFLILAAIAAFLFAYYAVPAYNFIHHSFIQKDIAVSSTKEWKHIVNKLLPHLMAKGDKFPSQKEDLWFQISTGLQGLSNNPKIPAVYLLTYDENSLHPSSCIVEVITTAANNFLLDKNGWSLLNGTLLTESRQNDPGKLIDKIASTLEKHKIIVVTDIQNIPAQLAQGFHFLVDEYNPKIREAVYILTLKIPSHLKSNRPVEAAENTLKECWKDLNYDLLMPLITRVTNKVLPVMAENSEISCPLITSVTTEIYI